MKGIPAGQPAEHHFQANGARITWFEWNGDAASDPSGNQPVVLMVHATGFHARCWDKTVEALPEGLRVIAVDVRGHGRSQNTGPIVDWQVPADDVAELVQGLDLNNIIGVGHSMGGHSLTQVAARLTERFSRLVLVDPVIMDPEYYKSSQGDMPVRPEDHPVAKRRNQWATWEDMFERFAGRHPYTLWRKDVLEDYCRYGLVASQSGEGLELACPPLVEASIYVGSAGTDIFEQISNVTVPVTVLRGKVRDFEKAAVMDFAASPTWPELAAAFPDGTDVYLPHLSHFIPMQDPQLVASHIVGAHKS